MIPWWGAVIALFAGIAIGIILIALVSVNDINDN